MDYKQMIHEAQKMGLTNEQKMWKSVEMIGEGMNVLKEAHPDMYWKMMREQHCLLYNGHYTHDFAEHDIAKMHSTDKDGHKHQGAHWSKDEVLSATSGKSFPQGVTDCDKWVAYNAMWHDMHCRFDDRDIIDIAYLFFFDDEDWPNKGTKIWDYNACVTI